MSEPTSLPVTDTSSGCGCGHDHDVPELDARTIPHAIRHGAVIGALGQVRPGAAMILVAPHNPLPLIAQIHDLEGEKVRHSYVQSGPDAWKILFERLR
ncbi:Uncharacterized conserved protein, DUF2249 family [Austwickia chelonae]|uniref:DUF2249 domain-containing protein n=1 Tax=Austwickia chelonae NBRC 105200 TaxID=1184607 RepID=K6UN99_9MICO|nr:DUF2249 domain-containing protein [Austwickia chelonae]GAB78801.1 hypothetical protein AUCHE_17_00110 [Austwickia chelonae NBRC 105200]SEV84487.1 Uncharacterized conserved protein, DUF2249 family [Austwickia chelonae]